MEIRLRQIEEEDLPQLRDWRNAAWLRPYVREYRLLNMVNQREWFEHISTSRNVEMFGIVVTADEYPDNPAITYERTRLAGVCVLTSINWVNRTAEVSLYVVPSAQRQGAGTEVLKKLEEIAFSEFNLQRIWAEIYEFNEPSIELFERAGFQLEGTLRCHVFKLGIYFDSLMYGKLKHDQ